ncbi:MAG: carboxypeptidase regulatory-like domain-containing protein [Phycisphaerae bacterium]|nr:carboxypeptidase regulatory-like domain-containing protein [Phycisphaerae bacterium]
MKRIIAILLPTLAAFVAIAPGATPADDDVRLAVADPPATAARRSARRRTMPAYTVAKVDNGGVIVGTVTYRGPTPAEQKLQIVKDHETCSKGPAVRPAIRLDDKSRVAEAVVFLANITQGKDFPKRDKPPEINQHFCSFSPNVQVVYLKEPVEIVNSDPVAHNINASQRIYTLFNILQPSKDMRSTKTFDRPGLVELKCNVHDWMRGFVYVMPHPYYQVTGADGAFRLDDVPPGAYELGVWQEHLAEQYVPVEVKAGQTATAPIVLEPKSSGD